MSKIEVNTIEPQCGTTLTLGASGDTVTLASGASQSGFGRTGTVDWDTTVKTSTFTAVSGDGFFCNTTAGAFTCNLPSGSAGAIVSLADYAATWDSNALTVSPNGSEKIGGVNDDVVLTTKGQSVTFIYVDSTQGWLNVQDSTSNERGNAFIVATGGTITTCSNDKIHTFTGPGTFTVCTAAICSANNQVSYMVVAGGGGAASGSGGEGGGGGGAGGFREDKSPITPYTASPLEGAGTITVSATGYPITVGGGGAGGTYQNPYNNNERGVSGSASIFSSITSAGGGGGGPGNTPSTDAGLAGGSGGGGGSYSNTAGAGNTPPVSPAQGSNGGTGGPGSPGYAAGGGGGATAAGAAGSPSTGGAGGAGATTSINGSPTAFSGGGGGGAHPAGTAGAGGTGGGGAGIVGDVGTAGTANTGGGAGGAGHTNAGGAGGSGIVIIRYKFQ